MSPAHKAQFKSNCYDERAITDALGICPGGIILYGIIDDDPAMDGTSMASDEYQHNFSVTPRNRFKFRNG